MNRFWIVGAVIICLLAALSFQQLHIRAINAEKETITTQRDEAYKTVDAMQKGLEALSTNAKANQLAQQALNKQLTETTNLVDSRDQAIRRLEDENESFKLWSNTALPNAVISLQQHPQFTSSADYRAWMSKREQVQPAREQGSNQR